MKGRSGGWRPGAGRPRINPTARELMAVIVDVQQRLVRLERGEQTPLILRKLLAIEQRLGLGATAPPKHTRRRPLGL